MSAYNDSLRPAMAKMPGGILGAIIAQKRIDVAARMSVIPLEALQALAAPTSKSLYKALSQPGARFIMEVKRASPSQGILCSDFNPRSIARAYNGVADAISVLTDEPYFHGGFDVLRTVREESSLPLLCKDFILSPWQIVEARAHGADAALLMLSVLDDNEVLACLNQAKVLGMDCLVEVHTQEEMDRALQLPISIIGINNRDLRTLTIDLSTTEHLASQVPSDRIVVTESGVRTRKDVDRLSPYVDAFLVGSSLMEQADVFAGARNLVFGRIKVCGLTRREDIDFLTQTGAAFGGLIFAKKSPRYVAPSAAEQLIRDQNLPFVGVWQNAPIEEVSSTAIQLGLNAVQLHGGESSAYVRELLTKLPDSCELWYATSLPDNNSTPTGVDRVLFDTKVGDQRGGTGQTFPWALATSHPGAQHGILAGGLNPLNIVEARAVGTWALDVNSGVEYFPGKKSREALSDLFSALRPRGRGHIVSHRSIP